MAAPFVVGVTEEALPAGATALGTGSKDPPPPPPPLTAGGTSDYQASVDQWLLDTRNADE
ncbi:MAG TPA: hypothetical protein VHN14_24150 [Kofleriaceae bacterium]|nr:hypothetical protein [Kofleriaceae bacterium]